MLGCPPPREKKELQLRCYCLINATLTRLHALRILAKGVCNHAQCGVGCMLCGTTYNQDSAVHDYILLLPKTEAREGGSELHLLNSSYRSSYELLDYQIIRFEGSSKKETMYLSRTG